jgi:dephospho-CoA kinase
MSLKIGITGGIGSGKSYVSNLFAELGVPVYNSDSRAKWLTENSPEILTSLRSHFGDEIFIEEKLHRKALGNIVFNNPTELQWLNDLIHPAVQKNFEAFYTEHIDTDYVLKEAAILIEAGTFQKLDGLILVTAPDEVKIARVMQRDNATREQVLDRMKNQIPDDKKVKYAQWVIFNDGVEDVRKQVEEVDKGVRCWVKGVGIKF